MKTDLHIHSLYSDGILSLRDITTTLVMNGVKVFSITDHDTVEGTEEAIFEAKRTSLEFIPGIEISCVHKDSETHILGYYIDHNSETLKNELKVFKENRFKRAEHIISKLKNEGITLNYRSLEKFVHNGVLGRPHIADLLVEKGIVKTRREAFSKFLGKGNVAYVPREKISVEKAVALIEGAGGVPVLAHPGLAFLNDELDKVIECGIKGVEVWHPDHNLTMIDHYYNYALKNDLIMTGGTDWHGDKCYKSFNAIQLPYDNIIRMKSLKKCLS